VGAPISIPPDDNECTEHLCDHERSHRLVARKASKVLAAMSG